MVSAFRDETVVAGFRSDGGWHGVVVSYLGGSACERVLPKGGSRHEVFPDVLTTEGVPQFDTGKLFPIGKGHFDIPRPHSHFILGHHTLLHGSRHHHIHLPSKQPILVDEVHLSPGMRHRGACYHDAGDLGSPGVERPADSLEVGAGLGVLVLGWWAFLVH